MKKVLCLSCLLAGLWMSVSCSVDSDTSEEDSPAEFAYMDLKKGANFDLAWIVDKQVVDTATFAIGAHPSFTIVTHLPIAYFLHLAGVEVAPADILYYNESYWLMDVSVVGNSDHNYYFSNNTWAPRLYFQIDGDDYECHVFFNTGQMPGMQTALMYDEEKNMWSGTAAVDSFMIVNLQNRDQWWEKKFTTPLQLIFQTTGRRD